MAGIRVSTLTIVALVFAAVIPAATPAPGDPGDNGAQQTKPKSADSKGLRRAAFQVTHASCVSCLRDIERSIRLTPGVKDVEVNIRPPYNSVVIYEINVTSLDTMFAPIRKRGYDCVNISEVPALGKNAVIARKEQKPAAADLEALLDVQ